MMLEVEGDVQETWIKAYVDEAGHGSFHRTLTPQDDGKFFLIVAVIFTPEDHDKAVGLLQPEFDKFVTAAPAGAKIHITDAFAPGNETWGTVATEVRKRYFEILMEIKPVILYGACRHRLARNRHVQDVAMKAAAQAAKRSSVTIVGSNRPSDERVQDDAFTSLVLRVDFFGELAEQSYPKPKIDLLFDQTNKSEADRYSAIIGMTETLSGTVETVKGFDTVKKEKREGTIAIDVGSEDDDFRLDTAYVGSITVIGKDHPLVFAADIVANALNKHLAGLADDAPLHAPSSVAGWELEPLVSGVSDDASDDLY